MSKLGYPASLNCWLSSYPENIRVTFGPEMENLAGPWANGSKIDLIRIGFDAPDTSPVEDEVPPDVKVTYSDNGTDVGWVFKMGMYGWGTFFAKAAEDNYFILLEKWLEFESTYFEIKKFRHREAKLTEIPKTESIPLVEVPVSWIPDPPDIPDPETPPVVTDPNPTQDQSLVLNLITSYWWIWNIDTLDTWSTTYSATADLSVDGYRQLAGSAGAYGSIAEFWTNGREVKIVFISTTITCPDFQIGEDPIGDCTYSTQISSAAIMETLIINGWDYLPLLIQRA